MSFEIQLFGRTFDYESSEDDDMFLRNPYHTTIACITLQYDYAKEILMENALQVLGYPAPAECYPYPGELEGCQKRWHQPRIFKEAAQRYDKFIELNWKNCVNIYKKSIFDWHFRKEPLFDDVQMEKFLDIMRSGIGDLVRVAQKLEDLGEDLAILIME